MSVLFVQQISIHHSRSDVDEKSLRAALKADYGYDGRRLSRFTLNALAAALPGNFGQTNYAASKFGVIGFTKTWARELGPKGTPH